MKIGKRIKRHLPRDGSPACASSSRSLGPAPTHRFLSSDRWASRLGQLDASAAISIRGSSRLTAQATSRSTTTRACFRPRPAPGARCRPAASLAVGPPLPLHRLNRTCCNQFRPEPRARTPAPAWTRAWRSVICPPSPAPGSSSPCSPFPSFSCRDTASPHPSALSSLLRTGISQSGPQEVGDRRCTPGRAPLVNEARIRKER